MLGANAYHPLNIFHKNLTDSLLLKACNRSDHELKIYIYEKLKLGMDKYNGRCARHFESEREIPKQIRVHPAGIYTNKPDEADFFLIDHDLTCTLTSRRLKLSRSQAIHVVDNYLKNVVDDILHNYPFYNNSGGHDHLFIFSIDKGCCHFQSNLFPIYRDWFIFFDNVTFIGNFGYSGSGGSIPNTTGNLGNANMVVNANIGSKDSAASDVDDGRVVFEAMRFGENCWNDSVRRLSPVSYCTNLRDIVVPQYHDWVPSPANHFINNNFYQIYNHNKFMLTYFKGTIKCGGITSRTSRILLFNMSRTLSLALSQHNMIMKHKTDFLNTLSNNDNAIIYFDNMISHKNIQQNIIKQLGINNHKFTVNISSAFFAWCPAGSAPWSQRLYDAIYHNTIPIILSDGIIEPFERFIDWTSFTTKFQNNKLLKEQHIILHRMFDLMQDFRSSAELNQPTSSTKSKLLSNFILRKLLAVHAASQWLHWDHRNVRNAWRLLWLELWCRSTKARNRKICSNHHHKIGHLSYW
jgi:hypothetical protein